MELLFLLVAAHALCDFPLQGEAMGAGKNRHKNTGGAYGADFPPWYAWLGAHGLIHGGAVYLITGSWLLGGIETLVHMAIDDLKCDGRISFDQDQLLHIACKVGYAAWLSML